ncbi:MAG: enoyl-CoA hydratase/isomerase family protein [Actinobacteria bacterium]|nr:MAG: enoyl-CoA hydratase/isomerase family protein [Actinomycetota bacterium]
MAPIQRERVAEGVEVLRLDRPEARNAMNSELLAAVEAALAELAGDPSLRVLIFGTTDVKALSAGADVREDLDAAGGVARMEAFARFYAAVEAFPLPTIAVCVGNVVGALAWAGARLGVPVGPARLAPLVGLARAKELILTARVLDQHAAGELGLLAAAVPAADAEATAIELAQSMTGPTEGLRTLKRMFRELEGSERRVAYENQLLVEFQARGAGLPRRP